MLCCLGKFEMGIYRPNPIMLAGRAAPDLLKSSHSHSFLPALASSFIYLQPFLAQSVHQLLSKQPFQQTIKLLHCCRLHFFFLKEQLKFTKNKNPPWYFIFFFTVEHTHTHTHTHVGFYGLRGLSIGVMIFILYKCNGCSYASKGCV